MNINSISVVGLGKLGACIAATFASRGFKVIGIDSDRDKVNKVNACEPPVDEPHLKAVMESYVGRLRASYEYTAALETDATFFVVPTPSKEDGSFSNEHLLSAMTAVMLELKRADKKGHIFVINSTTTPGSIDGEIIPALESMSHWKCGVDFGVCYNPEFVALGNVMNGLIKPDLILIGESDEFSGHAIAEVYEKVAWSGFPRRMSIINAELAKISVNAYVTMKISFTNQLRMIAERIPGADIHTILNALGDDSRIGTKYLKSGLSYGGPCFPRDNRMFVHVAEKFGSSAPLAKATDQINQMTNDDLVFDVIGVTDKPGPVAILGMSYKPGTQVTEESAGVALADQLSDARYGVITHNPPQPLPDLTGVPTVVICCPWPEYKSLVFSPETKVINPWPE